jgi:hypothetical protein
MVRTAALLIVAVLHGVPLRAEEVTKPSISDPAKTVFHKAAEEDRKAKNDERIVLGDYVLVAGAAKRLREVYTLERTLNELKHFDWSEPR